MRALYVATDLRDADVLQQEVRRAAPKLTFDVCSGTAEARPRIEGQLAYDVMILDSSLPEHEQQQTIEHVRSRQIPLPIVILVGQGTTPSSAIVSAADECITRGPRLAERLAPGLRMAMERYRVVATMTRENERLKRSEARLRLIIEAMPAGVVLVDQAGKIQAMNLAGAALVGTGGPSDVVGRELYSLADQDGIQALRELVGRAFDGARGKVLFTCHGPDGTLRPLQIEALCIQKDAQGQGSVLGVLSSASGVAPIAEAPAPVEEEASVDFAFANDPHHEERMALEQALEEVRADAARLQQEAESERARVQQVLEELERSRATAAEHHAQKAAVEGRVEEVEARRRDAEQATASATARIEQLVAEASDLKGERQKVQKELDAVRADLEKARAHHGEIAARAEAAEHERDRLTGAIAAAQVSAEGKLKELANELKAQQKKAEDREKAIAAELDKARADAVKVAEALEAQGKSSKGAEAALASARDALQGKVQQLEAQAAELETKRAEAVARLAELEEQRRADQTSLAAATKQAHELEAQLKSARDDAARASSERDGLKSELGRVHESHRAAEDDASLKASEASRMKTDLEGRIGELEARIHQLEAELHGAHEAKQAIHHELEGLKAQVDSARSQAEGVRADGDQVRAELDRVRGELTSARGELDGVRGELTGARGELDGVRGERDAFAREVEDVKAAVAKAAAVIEELRGAKDASESRVQSLTGDLEALRRQHETHGHQATDLQQVLERERAEARSRAEAVEREHQAAIDRLHKQIEEAREFQAAAAARVPGSERGRRRPGERLGQLASAMANDLHGIVNGMADEARKLLAELPEGSNVRAQAEQSLQSANRAGQLVRHLLRLSEREQRAVSGTDPNSLVRSNEPMLRQLAGPDIDLRFELTPSLPPVECDTDELAGVLSTLVVTVRGALPLGGTIRVLTQPPRKDGGRRRNDTSLALSVVAEGYGMVSVPTTVCDEVVTRSGGSFSAQVDLKGGSTTFTAYLPIDQAADSGVTNIA
jgi:PAS domain S-box-containing protein